MRIWLLLRDWLDGRDLGRHLAQDGATDEHGRLQLDVQMSTRIDNQVMSWSHQLRAQYLRAIDAARQDGAEAVQTGRRAEQGISAGASADRDLTQQERALGDRRGAGELGFLGTLGALFLLMLPLDVGAAQLLPLSRGMQGLFVVTLGGGMVAAADQTARKIDDARTAYASRSRDRFGFLQELILMVLSVVVPLLVVGGTTVWRGQAFEASFSASGGALHGTAVNLAFGFVALMAFVVAILVGLSYHHMKPLRRVRRRRKQAAKRSSGSEAVREHAKNEEAEAKGRVTRLADEQATAISALVSWGEQRKAKIRQHALVVELRIRRREDRPRRPQAPPFPANPAPGHE